MKRVKDKIIVKTNELSSIEMLFKIGMARDIETPLCNIDDGSLQVNLGAGTYKTILGTEAIDYPECDFEKDMLPYESNSVDVFHAYHLLEHLANPKHLLKECERCLKVGGYINIVVPYYSSSLQASCLDHKTAFNERTWVNTFDSYSYDNGTDNWKLKTHLNIIIGIEENNLALMTQLVKV